MDQVWGPVDDEILGVAVGKLDKDQDMQVDKA
jgi:hypothetical protein